MLPAASPGLKPWQVYLSWPEARPVLPKQRERIMNKLKSLLTLCIVLGLIGAPAPAHT